jgi:hypothetical protein
MCDPASAALAISSVGAGLSAWGGAQQQGAENNATNSYLARQQGLSNDAYAQFQRSLALAQPGAVNTAIAGDTAARMAKITAAGGTAAITQVPGAATGVEGANTSAGVKAALAQQNQINQTELGQEASGRAAMGGVGDAFQNLDYSLVPQGARIAEDENFVQGNQAAFQPIFQQASQAGSGLRSVGSLFGQLGKSASMSAGAGQFNPFGIFDTTTPLGSSAIGPPGSYGPQQVTQLDSTVPAISSD